MNRERSRWLRTKLSRLFRRRRQEAALDAELQFHFDQLVAECVTLALGIGANTRSSIMPTNFRDYLDLVLGLNADPHELGYGQMAARTLVMFVVLHQILRFAPKRFFAARNAFDMLLVFLLASVMSRAVNGDAAFFPTLLAGLILVVLYRILTFFACSSHAWGRWLKGTSVPLIADGVIDEAARRGTASAPTICNRTCGSMAHSRTHASCARQCSNATARFP